MMGDQGAACVSSNSSSGGGGNISSRSRISSRISGGEEEGVRWGAQPTLNTLHHHGSVRCKSDGRGALRTGCCCMVALLVWVAVLCTTAAAATVTPSVAAETGDCDVTASGLERSGREVGVAYVQCNAGSLLWRFPRNGLRFLLRSPEPGREFRACVRAGPSFGGARVLLEGQGALLPLITPGHHSQQRVHCFSSVGGQAALFLEAVLAPHGGDLNAATASLSYDLQLLPRGELFSPETECRPCSDEELLHSYCSAQFAASGRLLAVERRDSTSLGFDGSHNFLTPNPLATSDLSSSLMGDPSDETFLRFAASKVYKQPSLEDLRGAEELVFERARGGGVVGRVEVPSQCGMRAGPGDYLLMGRMRLGTPILTCIPRLEQFESLVKARGEQAPCVIKIQ